MISTLNFIFYASVFFALLSAVLAAVKDTSRALYAILVAIYLLIYWGGIGK